jgi:hypothetical protein
VRLWLPALAERAVPLQPERRILRPTEPHPLPHLRRRLRQLPDVVHVVLRQALRQGLQPTEPHLQQRPDAGHVVPRQARQQEQQLLRQELQVLPSRPLPHKEDVVTRRPPQQAMRT